MLMNNFTINTAIISFISPTFLNGQEKARSFLM